MTCIIVLACYFNNDVSASELSLFTLPARLGGMGINDPIDSAGIAFSTSRTCTKKIVDAIKRHGEFCVFDHNNQMHEAKKQQKVALNTSQQSTLASIMTSLSGDKKRAVKRAVDSQASIWLTVILVSRIHCFKDVIREPVVQESDDARGKPVLIADMGSLPFSEK